MRAVVPTAAMSDRAAGLAAVDDQHHPEGLALAHAAADHVDIAGLEDAQRQQSARKQHGVEREQRDVVPCASRHCASLRARRRRARRQRLEQPRVQPPKPPLLMISA
jgi:hypothetical protein